MANSTRSAVRRPTYGELIDLFEEAERECPDSEDLLCSKFRKLYPKTYIGRPRRFYETVLRVVAPTKPSLRGESRLSGSPLSSIGEGLGNLVYGTHQQQTLVTFPEGLYSYGLDELLASVFHQVQSGKEPLQWCLKGVPNIGFYQKLHPFLKWSITRQTTKVAIGKFYVAIDKNLKVKGSRADNVYRFIERVAKSTVPSESDKLMTYDKGIAELNAMRVEVKHCTEHVTKLNTEVSELKQQLEASRKQLHSALYVMLLTKN